LDFSTETLQARRKWDAIFKTLKENNCQPKLYTWKSCPSEMKER